MVSRHEFESDLGITINRNWLSTGCPQGRAKETKESSQVLDLGTWYTIPQMGNKHHKMQAKMAK